MVIAVTQSPREDLLLRDLRSAIPSKSIAHVNVLSSRIKLSIQSDTYGYNLCSWWQLIRLS